MCRKRRSRVDLFVARHPTADACSSCDGNLRRDRDDDTPGDDFLSVNFDPAGEARDLPTGSGVTDPDAATHSVQTPATNDAD